MSELQKKAFNGKAVDYAKGRPGYPDEIIKFVVAQGIGEGVKVADIGSGTGIFTKILLEQGAEVWGVEINDDMRNVAENSLEHYINFHSQEGSAEATGLPEKSVDFISAAQAFHWFDKTKFRQEASRILKPEGKIILLWNCELMDNPFFSDWGKIQARWIHKQTSSEVTASASDNKYSPEDYFVTPAKSFLSQYQEFRCPNPTYNSKDIFLARALSASAAPNPNEPEYSHYKKDLEKLFDRYQKNGQILYPSETVALIGTL